MNRAPMHAAQSEAVVVAFLAAWRDRNVDTIMSFMADDATYHNVPVAPIVGAAAIRDIFSALLGIFSEAVLEVVSVAAKPGLVLTERIDRFTMNDGRKVVVPVCGVFELREGKIIRFSDYFDLATFESASGLKL